MKKQVILLLAVFLFMLSGCGTVVQQSFPENEDSEETEVPASYPLLFLDKTNYTDQVYVLCAFEEGKLRVAEEFRYNGQELEEFIFQTDVAVETEIIDTTKAIRLFGPDGNGIEAKTGVIRCSGRPIDGTVEVRTEITQETSYEGQWFLGSYAEVKMFPEEITRGEKMISVDLNADGKRETIRWEFEPIEDIEAYGERFTYAVLIEREGKVHRIEEEWVLPILEEDLAVFVADLNLDGECEVIVYDRGMSKFGGITIYRLEGEEYSEWMGYVINPES